jgi:hypothetical protein
MNTKAQGMSLGRAATAGDSRDLPSEAGRAGDSLLCALLVVYLTSLLLEGVIRYVLAIAGVPNALYLRDAIPVATLVVLFMRPLLGEGRIDLAIAVPAALLLFHAAYSAMVGVAIFSIAFGLKIFMFIPYGMAMWPLIQKGFDRALTVASLMFAVAVAGVSVNFIVGEMPWEGLEYDTAFGAVSTTRMWWMGDAPRLPGFARTSFGAAMILGITGLLTLLRFRQPLAQLAIAACAMVAITLTTSKGMILAFPPAAIWVLMQQRNPRMNGAGLLGAVCGATFLLPLIIVYFDLGLGMSRSSFPSFLVSVWERFTDMWPLAFGLLPEGPNAVLGAGLGSIGTPQLFGDAPHRFNAGDNFAVFMIIVFGLPGLCYYAFPALSLRRVASSDTGTVHGAYVGLLVLVYGYGMSSNMVEDSFFSVSFGLCCGAAAAAWLRPMAKHRRWGELR